jgi:hemoglobin
MVRDIENRDDIYIVVSEFYKKLLNNDVMKHFFEKFTEENELEHHLQTLVDFWDNTIFYSGTYQKNAIQPHIDLNKKNPFESIHFQTWLQLFHASVDENFKGETAEITKNRATSIATVMQIKILQ